MVHGRVKGLEFFDLFNEICLLVVELFVLRPVRMELCEEVYQLVLVAQQDLQDRAGLVRVRHEHLVAGRGTIIARNN